MATAEAVGLAFGQELDDGMLFVGPGDFVLDETDFADNMDEGFLLDIETLLTAGHLGWAISTPAYPQTIEAAPKMAL